MLNTDDIVRVNQHYPDKWVWGLQGTVIGTRDNFVAVRLIDPPEDYMRFIDPWLFYPQELDLVKSPISG